MTTPRLSATVDADALKHVLRFLQFGEAMGADREEHEHADRP